MIFLAHLFMSETCFIQTTCGRTAQVFSNQRIHSCHGKCLLCKYNFRTCTLHYTVQDFQVSLNQSFVNNKTRRRQLFKLHLSEQAPIL